MHPDWWRKLSGQDRSRLFKIGLVGGLGILLLLFGSLGGRPARHQASPAPATSALGAEEAQVQAKLTAILDAIPGARPVSVAVTLSRSIESQFVNANQGLGSPSPLVVDSGNGQTVVPLDQIGPAVQGVVVVDRAAKNPVIRMELTQAVETLLQIGAYQVLIVPS